MSIPSFPSNATATKTKVYEHELRRSAKDYMKQARHVSINVSDEIISELHETIINEKTMRSLEQESNQFSDDKSKNMGADMKYPAYPEYSSALDLQQYTPRLAMLSNNALLIWFIGLELILKYAKTNLEGFDPLTTPNDQRFNKSPFYMCDNYCDETLYSSNFHILSLADQMNRVAEIAGRYANSESTHLYVEVQKMIQYQIDENLHRYEPSSNHYSPVAYAQNAMLLRGVITSSHLTEQLVHRDALVAIQALFGSTTDQFLTNAIDIANYYYSVVSPQDGDVSEELAQLPVKSDSELARVLAYYDLVQYSPRLTERIRDREVLAHKDGMLMEIRCASIIVCDEIAKYLECTPADVYTLLINHSRQIEIETPLCNTVN